MTTPVSGRARARWLLPTLSGYQRGWIGPDLLAGLSAGAVVIPQAMAYATIADLPPELGLYTCIVPMLVYAFLGGSRAMSVSTTSTIATLTATTMVTAGIAAGSDDVLGSVVTLTLLVGTILLGLRLLRLGALVENISSPTILGIQIGVGATVAVGQLPKLLGVDSEYSGHGFIRSFVAVGEALPSLNPTTVALSVASILVLYGLTRFAPRWPSALIVVVGGILLAAFTGIQAAGVALIAPIPQGLPAIHLPDLSHIAVLFPGALGIAVMAFLESIGVSRALRRLDEPQIDSNQELLAISAASIVGSFFATLPAAGGFSQSAVNQNSGARSQVSAFTTVALAVLVALFLGPVLSLLPQATLAALVFVAVVGLIKIGDLVRLARISPRDFWIATVTALIGLTAGLLPAVAAGVVITLVLVLRELNVPKLDVPARTDHAIVVHIGRGLYTANALENERAILDLAESQQPPIHAVVLDLERMESVGITVLDVLADLDRELAGRSITLHIARLPEGALRIAERYPWYRKIQAQGRTHPTGEDGLAAASEPPI
ncbi:SulP family inorganic anion transporter [uncultured Microbacterium sp.]|uniref:SulP family inorganic anion transporter n=1 Tax=uncultured Microbacterium sp. TaxID=191216 RepID=UPI0035CC3BD2